MESMIIQGFNELPMGTKLSGGKYTILSKIGEGGFSITYKGVQEVLGRTVCIKEYFPAGRCLRDTQTMTIHPQGISGEVYYKYRDAFAKEAAILASLDHRNIVEVIDVFEENNTSYMVMAYIEGRSLQSIVDNHGKLFYPAAINYIGQITDAVSYVHRRNILHRDIKPDNIMITADNRAILIDFGSARTFEHDKTQFHTSMVTHGYAPTEQYSATSRKGAYTDIYAIGATLYFVLTGKAPLEAAARLSERLVEPRALEPSIPAECNRTILKAMQLKSEDRHQTTEEFMDDLCSRRSPKPEPKPKATKAPQKRNKSQTPYIILATILLLATAAFIFMATNSSKSTDTSSSYSQQSVYETVKVQQQVYQTVDVQRVEQEDFSARSSDITFTLPSGERFKMVYVEGGSFDMGATSEQVGADSDEFPAHNVTLSSYYIAEFEVTQKLWKAVMGTTIQQQRDKADWSDLYGVNDSYPMYYINYSECEKFVGRLNNLLSDKLPQGYRFSLPSEAQWEYAARGGNKVRSTLYAGGSYISNIAWYTENSGSSVHPVGDKQANELGIYDMSGNVYEWCVDWYSKSYYETSPDNNPVNLKSGSDRVLRGGCFTSKASSCRVADRDHYTPSFRSYNFGMRVALVQ